MSEFTIEILVDEAYQVDADALRLCSWEALRLGGAASPCAITITVTSSEAVHDLNRQYAGIDSTTDVLSFAAEDEAYNTEPGEPPYLGDVVIAYPVAAAQASEQGIVILAELQTLAVHGTLHLLGYDHDTPENQAEMWAYQSAALDAARSG